MLRPAAYALRLPCDCLPKEPLLKHDDMVSPDEFARWLRLGLGRAVLYLRQHDATAYRDAIVHTIRHIGDVAYDPQSEGPRGQYLLDIVRETADFAFFRTEILDGLANESETWSLNQLFEMARILAKSGDAEARSGMYSRFATHDEDLHIFADELVELDGIEGAIFIANRLGAMARDDSEFWDDRWLEDLIQEHTSVTTIEEALGDFAITNPNVAAYLAVIRSNDDLRAGSRGRRLDFRSATYDDLLASFATARWDQRHVALPINRPINSWGEHASEGDIRRAAIDLIQIPPDEVTRLRLYLQIFWQRAFPEPPDFLIRLIDHPDERVPWFALNALESVAHPTVRALGFTLLESPEWRGRAIDMFLSNLEPSDFALFERLIASDLDDDDLHHIGFSLEDIHKRYRTPDSVGCVLLLYDRDPCSECRERLVRILINLDALPDWMAQECLWDANLDTREAVRAYLAQRP